MFLLLPLGFGAESGFVIGSDCRIEKRVTYDGGFVVDDEDDNACVYHETETRMKMKAMTMAGE